MIMGLEMESGKSVTEEDDLTAEVIESISSVVDGIE
jgi:hypothetical protein